MGAGEARVAQQRVVVGDRRGAGARARQRVGQQRPTPSAAAAAAEPAPSRSERPATTSRAARRAHDRRAGARRDRGRWPRRREPARPSGRPLAVAAGSGSPRTSGSRSGKLRCTAPGRPPAAVQYARHASWRIQRRRSGVASWVPTSKNHFAGVAVELELVDRLAGADVAQLGRAVGGEHDQRDARLVRLDHGRAGSSRPRSPTCTRPRPAARSPWRGRARRSPRRARRRATSRAAAARARAPAPAASSASRARCTRRRTPQRASSSTKARSRR